MSVQLTDITETSIIPNMYNADKFKIIIAIIFLYHNIPSGNYKIYYYKDITYYSSHWLINKIRPYFLEQWKKSTCCTFYKGEVFTIKIIIAVAQEFIINEVKFPHVGKRGPVYKF